MKKAFLESIFNDYRDKVFGFFLSSLGHRELAGDLTQDLFYKLCQKKENLDEIRDMNSYIFWMAQNMVIDHLRRAAHQRKYREELVAAWKNSKSYTFHQKPEIEQQIDQEHYDELFEQLVHELTPQQKLIVTLSKKDGLSNRHIAQKLGLSHNTVKNHLHQALKTLRSELNANIDYSILLLLITAALLWFERFSDVILF